MTQPSDIQEGSIRIIANCRSLLCVDWDPLHNIPPFQAPSVASLIGLPARLRPRLHRAPPTLPCLPPLLVLLFLLHGFYSFHGSLPTSVSHTFCHVPPVFSLSEDIFLIMSLSQKLQSILRHGAYSLLLEPAPAKSSIADKVTQAREQRHNLKTTPPPMFPPLMYTTNLNNQKNTTMPHRCRTITPTLIRT